MIDVGREIRFALISEGPSERPLVDHLITLCLREGMIADGEWPDLRDRASGKSVESQLSCLLEMDSSFDLVFIHRDADDGDDGRMRELIAKGVASVDSKIRGIPVVPIRELEAWLLVDEAAIRRAARNVKGRQPLNLPKLGRVEAKARPKEALLQALELAAKPGRDRSEIREKFSQLRRELLQNLDIDGPVTQLSAWQNLLRDLHAALAELASPSSN
ncbi:hypothetical protein ACNOYE_18865 [Nannocystaceae bacterium ST9]